jgi:signal transduction histidine kinase
MAVHRGRSAGAGSAEWLMTGPPLPSTVVAMDRALAQVRRLWPAPPTVDGVLAAVLAAVAELELWRGGDFADHRTAGMLLALATTAAVAVRRRYPLLVGAGVPVGGAFIHAFWNPGSVAYPIATFCTLYALAAWTTPRRFAAGTLLVVAADPAARAAAGESLHPPVSLYTVVVVVVMLLVRQVLGERERRIRLAERERVVAAREAVVQERGRIARELHDAVAHDVSLMVVQAGAERRVLDGTAGSTRDVLETIEKIGRASLEEMRRLVGMLRSDDGDPLVPQPGLGDLPGLVAQVQAAGLRVELAIEGEQRALPVGIELSAYRIVQEALTNTLKHAGRSRATVRVRFGVRALNLEVVDDGDGAVATARFGGGGHGLVGMRERTALYGGRLDAGPRPGGGFAVRAVLPVE